MTWPSPQEYNEAVQNPARNLDDPELQVMKPELTRLGVPRPVTGNFASVYRLTAGPNSIAVRCFFRDFADMGLRYQTIGAHLRSAALPYTVGFSYLKTGIRVRTARYPLLKMDWVDGELLDRAVEKRLNDPAALSKLAESWLRMAMALRSAGVGHGDLQHGNVMLVGGRLRLVDYDGMFVPGLRGYRSQELGHPNYQHPGRDETLFDATVDNFSHWVIYTSLMALAWDPKLWPELNAGDERLLFSAEDFRSPESSPAFRVLIGAGNETVRRLARTLRAALDGPAARTPALDPAAEPGRLLTLGRLGLLQPLEPVPDRMPSWVRDHIGRPGLAGPDNRIRLMVLGCFAAAGLDQMPAVAGAVPLDVRLGMSAGLPVLAVGVILTAFLQEPSGRDWYRTLVSHVRALRVARAAQRRCRRRESQLQDFPVPGTGDPPDTPSGYSTTARAGIQQIMRADLDRLAVVLKEIDDDERRRLEQALESYRSRLIHRALSSRSVLTASIPGVGPLTRARLWARGIRNAASVDEHGGDLPAILPAREAAAILRWYAAVRREAERSTATSLPDARMDPIRRRYARERMSVEACRLRIVMEGARVLQRIQEIEEEAARAAADRRAGELQRVADRRNQLAQELAAAERQRQIALRHVGESGAALAQYAPASFAHYVRLLVLGRRLGRVSEGG